MQSEGLTIIIVIIILNHIDAIAAGCDAIALDADPILDRVLITGAKPTSLTEHWLLG